MHVVITGTGRTATKWLAAMIEQSTTARVAHEPIGRRGSAGIRAWRDGHEAVITSVCVDSYARHLVGPINDALKPRWLFLIRPIMPLLRSAYARPNARARFEHWKDPTQVLRVIAAEILGGIEASLAEFEGIGVEPDVWGFADYTTERGLRALIESVGLRIDGPIDVRRPINVGDPKLRPPTRSLRAVTPHVRQLLAAFPRTSHAYAKAAERLASR